jgi:hypothetical protein
VQAAARESPATERPTATQEPRPAVESQIRTALEGLPAGRSGQARRWRHLARRFHAALLMARSSPLNRVDAGRVALAGMPWSGQDPPSTDANDPTKTIPAPYNGGNSSGSNLGSTSKALIDRVAEDAKTLQAENPGSAISVALVTTSASGLDSDLTPHSVYDRHGDATWSYAGFWVTKLVRRRCEPAFR